MKKERIEEKEAVYTTIVGGRPPGCGTKVGEIPRGIEVMVKKASVDPEFKEQLVRERGKAAESINLKLTPAETAMLSVIPENQLEKIIDSAKVAPQQKNAFMSKTAVLMLAAVGASILQGCENNVPQGIRPDQPGNQNATVQQNTQDTSNSYQPLTKGSRPDIPNNMSRGIRPDRPKTVEPTEAQPTPAGANGEDSLDTNTILPSQLQFAQSAGSRPPERGIDSSDIMNVSEALSAFMDKNELGATILKGNFAEAREKYSKSEDKDKYPEIARILDSLEKLNAFLLKSLEKDAGKQISLAIDNSGETATIISVADGKLKVEMKMEAVVIQKNIPMSSLSITEISTRLKEASTIDSSLFCGVVSWQQKMKNKAAEYFRQAKPLSEPLLAQMIKQKEIRQPRDLEKDYSFGIR
ncbi:MAG TPA: hypothetical protein DCZ94_20500 [Lentisphaeria bacterium]|nr:MAG: hypothetical protein A2X48_16345 [Lentisphaerae bacterium GWF2_49_21]HBC89329.1 hypothetical protein [Lentisphaeria bacterium]